jgi:multidrug efflux pump subunit AcrA (membrane-fusion protein)
MIKPDAQAALTEANYDERRQQQFFAQGYVSQAALDLVEARFNATREETRAQLMQVSVTQIQAGYYVIRAPYAGVVNDIHANVGDITQLGGALLTAHLHVTTMLPQNVAMKSDAMAAVRLKIWGICTPDQWHQQVLRDTRQSWLGVTTGLQRVAALDCVVHASDERVSSTDPAQRLSQQVGDRSTLDLLNAESEGPTCTCPGLMPVLPC